MRQFLAVLALTLFVSSASFASFPVKNSSSNETSTEGPSKKAKKHSAIVNENSKVNEVAEVKASEAQVKSPKQVENKKAAKGDDTTVAIILAIVSVLFLPFGLHNWYLGRKKQALWQTLLTFPGFILIIPFVISWIWQIVDLIRLIANGELPG